MAVEQARRRKLALTGHLQSALALRDIKHLESFSRQQLIRELTALLAQHERLSRKLDQLQFEAEPEFRSLLQEPASVPTVAMRNEQSSYMTYAPIAVFFMVLWLFVVPEFHAGRGART